jgi:hypothetical protein
MSAIPRSTKRRFVMALLLDAFFLKNCSFSQKCYEVERFSEHLPLPRSYYIIIRLHLPQISQKNRPFRHLHSTVHFQ